MTTSGFWQRFWYSQLYRELICAVLCAWPLAIVVFTLIAAVAEIRSSTVAVVLLTVFATTLLIWWAIYYVGPRVKHAVRAGACPMCIFGADVYPRTESELVSACVAAYANGDLVVVSHAWSFYLAKRRARGSRVWTLEYTGSLGDGFWACGTSIETAKEALAAQGRAFSTFPTMSFASLGSWISSVSHGHPGRKSPEGGPLSWVAAARVLDAKTGIVTTDSSTELMRKFGSTVASNRPTNARYVVLAVKINSVPNIVLERFVRKMESVADADWWLKGEHLRILFVGSYGSLGFVWNAVPLGQSTTDKHWHPHICGSFCFWATVDALAATPFGRVGDLSRFDGYATLDGANASINDASAFGPMLAIWGQVCAIYNAELFLSVTAVTPELIHTLILILERFHSDYGGRFELRVDGNVLCVDISLRSLQRLSTLFGVLHKAGFESAAQHPGKFLVASLSPLTEVNLFDVFAPPSTV